MATNIPLTDTLFRLMVECNGIAAGKIDTVQYGYIAPSERLFVPGVYRQTLIRHRGMKAKVGDDGNPMPDDQQIYDSDFDPSDLINLTASNLDAFGGGERAIPYAYMRALLINNGYLYPELVDRGIMLEEVEWTDSNAPQDVITLVSNWLDANSSRAKEAASVASVLPYVVALIFRTQGHHWKNEDNFTRMSDAIFSALQMGDALQHYDRKTVFRTVVHPFGVLCFEEGLAYDVKHRSAPEPILIRSDMKAAGFAAASLIDVCRTGLKKLDFLALSLCGY
jgi:hypothetical protein